MSENLKKGDDVTWNTSQGKTRGKVKAKLSRTRKIKGHTVKASPDEPQYLVVSDKTGQAAAHKADSLHKT